MKRKDPLTFITACGTAALVPVAILDKGATGLLLCVCSFLFFCGAHKVEHGVWPMQRR